MNLVQQFDITVWNQAISDSQSQHITSALESGQLVLLPRLSFQLTDPERKFLKPEYVAANAKNISYDSRTDALRHTTAVGEEQVALHAMLKRFVQQADSLLQNLLPAYAHSADPGRSSYRCVEAKGRESSYRKDDTQLHVDAFTSNPNQGRRILRLFSNINPDAKPRVWRVGEPFSQVAQHFMPTIKRPFPGSAALFKTFGVTKTKRSAYDHYMLRIHNKMKADHHYQQTVPQQVLELPAGSTWLVFTDQVSHAVLSGQYLLEQTFYLPVTAQAKPEQSPLKILEGLLDSSLV